MYVLGPALEHGTLETPAEGKIAWTGHDLAQAAAIILTREGMFDGATPPLTASTALDFRSLCAVASALLGRSFAHSVVSEDSVRANSLPSVCPLRAWNARSGLCQDARQGEFDKTNATLERVLGRAPHTMRDELERMLTNSR